MTQPSLHSSSADLKLGNAPHGAIEAPDFVIFPLGKDTAIRTTGGRETLPIALGAAQQIAYLAAVRRECAWLRTNGVAGVPEVPVLSNAEQAHAILVNAGLGKVGLRGLHFDQNTGTITGRHTVVPHCAYSSFQGPENATSLRTFGAVLGAAAVIITSDNQILLQNCSLKERVYGDVPGVSAAALVEGNSALLDAVDFDMRTHILSVLEADLTLKIGLPSKDINSTELLGLVLDQRAFHHGLAFLQRTNLPGIELLEQCRIARDQQAGRTWMPQLFLLPATPDAIQQLLVEMKTPFPATHAAHLLMVGERLAEAAQVGSGQAWREATLADLIKNYKSIDRLTPAGRYDPRLTPERQQLPGLHEELRRVFGDGIPYLAA